MGTCFQDALFEALDEQFPMEAGGALVLDAKFAAHWMVEHIEDFDEAARLRRARGSKFDEYCSWISRNSDSSQCITIGGYI